MNIYNYTPEKYHLSTKLKQIRMAKKDNEENDNISSSIWNMAKRDLSFKVLIRPKFITSVHVQGVL